MAIQIADGFQLRVAKPLDDRQNVETVAQLDPTYGYEGQIVYVKDIKKFYTCYKDENGSLAYKAMETGNAGGGSASSEEQIKDWVSGSSYLEGDYIYREGEIYRCLTSNNDVDFDEANWKQLTYGIDELSKEDVEGLLGLTEEEIETMANLIADTEVRLDKTYSSSKIDNDFLKKVDADSKYATITTLTTHTNDANIHVTTTDKAKWDKVIDKVDTTDFDALKTKVDASYILTKEKYNGSQSVDVDLNGRCAFVISSQYAGYGCAYLLLSNFNYVCSVVKLGGSDKFKVTATHKSNSVDTITVSTGADDYSWYIVYM